MFKGLRNSFLFLHMGIVTAIIIVFFCTIWFSNYQGVMNRSSDILLRDMTEWHGMERGGPPGSPILGRDDRGGRGGGRGDGMGNPRFSPTFSVVVNADGGINQIDSVFSADETFYSAVTWAALEKNKDAAIISYDGAYFKYLKQDTRIVFIDISNDMQMLRGMGFTFLWIALPLLAALFLISLFFANRSIKPIEISYNKQKEFIADASHELKTPLAAISTNVDMLLTDSSTEQQKWLYYIKAEIGRMSDLTQSLLFLTRLDYDKQAEGKAQLDFSNLIGDYLLPLEAVFYEKNIRTKIDLFPGVQLFGNSEQLRRLVGTLVDNAIKYNGGNIRITLEKRDNDAIFTVFNDGCGIAPGELDKIWDRFYRGDKSRNSAGGFGLGLPIARAIAEKHGGSIAAESHESEWTRFTLKLPLK